MRNVSVLIPGICVATLLFACTSSESGSGDGDGDGSGGGELGGDGDSAASGGGDGDISGDGDVTGVGGSVGDGDGDVTPPMPSSGCGMADPPSGALSMTVGDIERNYIVSLPDGYDPENAYPV